MSRSVALLRRRARQGRACKQPTHAGPYGPEHKCGLRCDGATPQTAEHMVLCHQTREAHAHRNWDGDGVDTCSHAVDVYGPRASLQCETTNSGPVDTAITDSVHWRWLGVHGHLQHSRVPHTGARASHRCACFTQARMLHTAPLILERVTTTGTASVQHNHQDHIPPKGYSLRSIAYSL